MHFPPCAEVYEERLRLECLSGSGPQLLPLLREARLVVAHGRVCKTSAAGDLGHRGALSKKRGDACSRRRHEPMFAFAWDAFSGRHARL